MNLSRDFSVEVLTADLERSIREEVASATPIETLRTKDHKLLQIMQAEDGEKFVTRRYSQEGINVIQGDSRTWDMPFEENWEMMLHGLAAANITPVNSVLLRDVDESPYVIVSEFLENGVGMHEARTETKCQVAKSLGKLVTLESASGFVPNIFTIVKPDMFLAREKPDGTEEALLVDVDPYLHEQRVPKPSEIDATAIDIISGILWDNWCLEDERERVFVEFVKEIADMAMQDFSLDSPTAQSFQVAHFMSNGVDTRN